MHYLTLSYTFAVMKPNPRFCRRLLYRQIFRHFVPQGTKGKFCDCSHATDCFDIYNVLKIPGYNTVTAIYYSRSYMLTVIWLDCGFTTGTEYSLAASRKRTESKTAIPSSGKLPGIFCRIYPLPIDTPDKMARRSRYPHSLRPDSYNPPIFPHDRKHLLDKPVISSLCDHDFFPVL